MHPASLPDGTMETPVSTATLPAFAESVREYCELVSVASDDALLSRSLFGVLAGLCSNSLALDLTASPPGEGPDVAQAESVSGIALPMALPFRYYREIFNPFDDLDEEPVMGDLADDLIDIYHDLHPGLSLWDSGKRQDAADYWAFHMVSHWGEHATSAIRALYWWIRKEEMT